MKDLYHLHPKAYKEGYQILDMLPQESKDKIPEKIWDFIIENMDNKHEVTVEDIHKNNLLEDTNILLAILYKQYMATEEEKKIIKAKEKIVERRKEKEAYEKYNPNDIFKKHKK